jgi:hypothetical protein
MAANKLDDAISVAPVSGPVEPDESACFTQTGVKPMQVFPSNYKPQSGAKDYAVVKNTLVFTSNKGRSYCKAEGGLPAKSLNHFDRLLPVVGIYKNDCDLAVVGVAYDGVVSENDAKAYPDAMGRVVVQLTGSVTCTIHPTDIAKLDVNDLICLSGEEYVGGLVGMPHVTLPKIVKYKTSPYMHMLRLLLARLEHDKDVDIPISPWAYATAICALHQNEPGYEELWNACTSVLNQLKKEKKPISKAKELQRDMLAVFQSIQDTVKLQDDELAVIRVIASVYTDVEGLNKLYREKQKMPSAFQSLSAFKPFLKTLINARMPFGYVLELGQNQARILLKPGVTL